MQSQNLGGEGKSSRPAPSTEGIWGQTRLHENKSKLYWGKFYIPLEVQISVSQDSHKPASPLPHCLHHTIHSHSRSLLSFQFYSPNRSPSPQKPLTYSVSRHLSIPNISYKWKGLRSGFQCLAPFFNIACFYSKIFHLWIYHLFPSHLLGDILVFPPWGYH